MEDEVQGVAGLGELAGEVEIALARRRVAARVGVEGDDAGGADEDRRAQDLGRRESAPGSQVKVTARPWFHEAAGPPARLGGRAAKGSKQPEGEPRTWSQGTSAEPGSAESEAIRGAQVPEAVR